MYTQETSETPTLVKTTPKVRQKKHKAKPKSRTASPFDSNLRANLVARYRFWKNIHTFSGEMLASFEKLGKELSRK